MTINYNGNVGINSITPSEKLEVTGNIKSTGIVSGTTFSGSTSASVPLVVNPNATGTIDLTVQSTAGDVILSPATGYGVGIGTTSPDAPIHVKGGTAMTSGWNRTATLEATFPSLIFNSNNVKWAGILYDNSSNLNIRVGATSNDVVASGINALSIVFFKW